MSEKYIPLYRKYRPQTFYDLIGQEHITQALSNAIKLDRISHAYLFCGPRGTGKTSSARILAKSLNCQEGPTLKPCGKCPSCIDITNSTPMDVIEIDAASNRGVDDTQKIIEKIQYVPVHGKFKIYVIDEVHQLSSHSFNALLKTLEEPPENVIFILATTEPQKVLETVISRCQRFDFKRITVEDIVKRLKFISEQENININDDALLAIAKSSAGGMRDSLSLLDQVSILDVSRTITVDDIEALLGKISNEILYKICDLIFSQNIAECIKTLDEIYSKGNEPIQIITNLIQYIRNLLILKNLSDRDAVRNLTQLSDDYLKKMSMQVQEISSEQLLSIIEKLSTYLKEIKSAPNPYMWTQLCFIDLTAVKHCSYDELLKRIEQLESTRGQVAPVLPSVFKMPEKKIILEKIENSLPTITVAAPKENIVEKVDTTSVDVVEEVVTQSPSSSIADKNSWSDVLCNIEHTPSRVLFSSKAQPVELSADKVVITFANEIFVMQAKDNTKFAAIQKAVDKYYGKSGVPIEIRLKKDTDVVTLDEGNKKKIIEPQRAQLTASVTKEFKNTPALSNEQREIAQDKTSHIGLSEQADLVLDLFCGKIVD